MLVVCSAGNSGLNTDQVQQYPSALSKTNTGMRSQPDTLDLLVVVMTIVPVGIITFVSLVYMVVVLWGISGI